MARACTVCAHENRTEIDKALVSGTAIRDIAGQHALTKSAVDRHRTHIGTLLAEAGQRKTELEVVHGDDLLAQSEAIDRDLRAMLGEAKQAQSLGACLQVIDRMQRQLALRAQLQERAAVASEGHVRYEVGWIDSCPRHPYDCGCPPDA